MANEFVARRGLKVLTSGIQVTGSSEINGALTATSFSGDGSALTNVTGSYVEFTNVQGLATFSSSVDTRLSAQEAFSSSLDASFVSETELTNFSSSINTRFGTAEADIDALETRAGLLESATSSLDARLDSVESTTSSFSGRLNAIESATSSLNTRVTDLESFSSSLDATFATDAELASLSSSIDTRLNGIDTEIGTLQAATSSYAVKSQSNVFTVSQSISDVTNSTNYTNGALTIAGGLGVGKDVNISGSLTVTGLLTAVSMSTQFVTSSQYTIGTSRVVVNDNDLVRFAGLSVRDSGSTPYTGSLLWDSLKNHWIVDNEDVHGTSLTASSAVLITGPETIDDVGNEIELVIGRVPVAVSDHSIDNRDSASPLRVDGGDFHIETDTFITGAVSSSVGFAGDGSALTGIVTTLSVTGSDTSTSSVDLKSQGLSFANGEGIITSVTGQTVTIAGEDASTTNKGLASFNSSHFVVNSGVVSASAITLNGSSVNLGGSLNLGLSDVTGQSATTTDTVTLGGGAVIHGVLYSSGSAASIVGPVSNQIIATVATGSYDAAHFDYVIKDGTNFRTGTVLAVWDGTNIEYTETSTNDIGNTNGATFVCDLNGGQNARLKFSATSGTWTVKTSIRAF
jgi:hypothetical protein